MAGKRAIFYRTTAHCATAGIWSPLGFRTRPNYVAGFRTCDYRGFSGVTRSAVQRIALLSSGHIRQARVVGRECKSVSIRKFLHYAIPISRLKARFFSAQPSGFRIRRPRWRATCFMAISNESGLARRRLSTTTIFHPNAPSASRRRLSRIGSGCSFSPKYSMPTFSSTQHRSISKCPCSARCAYRPGLTS